METNRCETLTETGPGDIRNSVISDIPAFCMFNVSLRNKRSTESLNESGNCKMNEDTVTIEFKYPWTMMPIENAGDWINAVSKSLKNSDPLYGKKIFVSGHHEFENLILVDNDTDGNYGVMSFEFKSNGNTIECRTIEVLDSRRALAEKLLNDHAKAVKRFKQN